MTLRRRQLQIGFRLNAPPEQVVERQRIGEHEAVICEQFDPNRESLMDATVGDCLV